MCVCVCLTNGNGNAMNLVSPSSEVAHGLYGALHIHKESSKEGLPTVQTLQGLQRERKRDREGERESGVRERERFNTPLLNH